jgi:antirestriction protein ArdC
MDRNQEMWDKVTARFISAIDNYSRTQKWVRPWKLVTPQNKFSGHIYSGTNHFMLMFSGYESTEWATFHQWSEAGYKIRAKEKTTPIFSPPFFFKTDKVTGEKTRIPCAPKTILLLNAEQIENYVAPEKTVIEVNQEHEQLLLQRDISVVHNDKNSAHYSPTADVINMPPKDSFESAGAYLATLAHECVHWTGHSSRLNRISLTDYRNNRAYEELVAEIGSAFICSKFGIEQTELENPDTYIGGWATLLTNKHTALKDAVKESITAVNYLFSFIHSDS